MITVKNVVQIRVSTVDTIIYRAVSGRSTISLLRRTPDIIRPDTANDDRLLHTYLNLLKEM